MAAARLGRLKTSDGEHVTVQRLTHAYVRRHTQALLAIHNQIPHLSWSQDELIADHDKHGTPYYGRWQMSLVAHCRGEPVALLLAYVREPDDSHPLESAYIHRLAVAERWQRQGIGSALVRLATSWYFSQLPWLLTVATQTNDEMKNTGVIDFYRKLGFRSSYAVIYPHKRDVIFEIERAAWDEGPHDDIPVRIDLGDTPFAKRSGSGVPQVYFGTSSTEKLWQYQHLMRCYGLGLRRLRPTVSFVEPQVEGFGAASEAALVAEPLKWFARFAAKADTYPLIIEDTMLFIEHFNSDWAVRSILPGADTKRWWQALEAGGVLRLMEGSTQRAARYVCQLGVNAGPGDYRTFRAELNGSIAHEPSDNYTDEFPLSNGTFFHAIFVPDGETRTLAELEPHEFVSHDYRRNCVRAAAPFLHECAARIGQIELFAEPTF
jgi:inosine/xanthosine triphosphate pyrophosphatase family protein/GNAT superfamily N-acetyltransferase